MITFMPDEFTKTVTVNIEDDGMMENDKMFFGRLSRVPGDTTAIITQDTATITIVDDDGKYVQ